MATPESNYQLTNLLMAPVREGVGRYMDAQVQIAQRAEQERRQREMMNLRRMQEIQDQQTEAEMRKALVAQQVEGQKDIANLQLNRTAAQITADKKEQEAKFAADEKRRTREAIRAAKAEYTGPEDLDKFGPEDDPATLNKILNATKAHNTKIAGDSVKAALGSIQARRATLVGSLKPTDEELGIITGNAANLYSTGEFKGSYERYNALLSSGISPVEALEALKQNKPDKKFVQMVEYSRASELRNLLTSKMKAPDFQVANESLAKEESMLGNFALKNNVGNLLFDSSPAAPAGDGGKKDAKTADATTFATGSGAGAGTTSAGGGGTAKPKPTPKPDVSNLTPSKSEGSNFSLTDWALPIAATPWEKIPGAIKNIDLSRARALLRLLGPRVASFGGALARNAGPAARMVAGGYWLGDKFNDVFPNNGLAQIGRSTADMIESPLDAEYARIAAERQRAAQLANLTLRQ